MQRASLKLALLSPPATRTSPQRKSKGLLHIIQMVKWYYTVIVGTQPGVYADWTQVAPKVSEISGAIHKKFKTRAEAREAFNRAAREGAVRVVPVDPDSELEPSPAPSSPMSAPQDNSQRLGRRHHTQEYWFSQEAPHEQRGSLSKPLPWPTTRPQRYFHRDRTASSTNANIVPSMHAGPSDLAERVVIDAGGRERNQGSRKVPADAYSSERYGSPSSRPVDLIQGLAGPSNGGHSNERWQESQHGPVETLSSSPRADGRTAIPHGVTRPADTSTEARRRFWESPSAAPLRSPKSSHSTHRAMRLSQIEDRQGLGIPGNAARTHSLPPSAWPLTDSRADVGPEAYAPGRLGASPRVHDEGDKKGKRRASIIQGPDAYLDSFDWPGMQISTPCQTGIETDDSLSVSILSRPPSVCSHISVASSTDTFRSVMSFDVPQSVLETPEPPGRPAHIASLMPQSAVSSFAVSSIVDDAIPSPSPQEGLNEEENGDNTPLTRRPVHAPSGDSRPLGGLSDDPLQADRSYALGDNSPLSRPLSLSIVASTSQPSTHLLCSPLPPPLVDLETPRLIEPTGLGLSIEGAVLSSSQCHALPHQTTTLAPAGSLPHPCGGGSATCNHTQSEEMRPTGGTAPSPRNVPLPSSPAMSTSTSGSGSSAHSRAQPSHRLSPDQPFYPSLAGDDFLRSSPSGLHIAFGLPTPGMSPIQVPATIRSLSADPRSPIPSWSRIPGIVMGLSRNVFFGRPTPPRDDARIVPL